MMNRSQKYTISGVLTLLTVATTAGIGRGDPTGVPAQLTSNNINVFRETETMNGVTLRKDQHNIVICPANTESRVASADLERTTARFWVYQYSGREPAVTGEFYISPGELGVNPQYSAIDTLRRIAGGKRYYVMSAVTLQFKCNEGLSKKEECGDEYIDMNEQCDDGNQTPNDGCSQCQEDFCEDSDATAEFPGGVGNVKAKGTVRGTGRGGGIHMSADLCVDAVTLIEHGCNGTMVSVTNERCPNGCLDGACKPEAECGNGIQEGDEGCDVVHEGCNQDTCTANEGYVCQNNVCKVYIPILGGGSSSTASSQSSRINENWHTECRNSACVLVKGFGAPNQCQLGRPCGGSSSSIYSASSQSSQGRLETSIISVQNANPDADGSAVPTGVSHVGQFRFTAAPSAPEEERDRAGLDALIFTVNASNVVVSTTNIHLYNKSDLTHGHTCRPLYPEGSPYAASSVSGLFLVICEGLRDSIVQVEIDPGDSQTFALKLDVMNPRLNGEHPSRLQVSLEQINLEQAVEFGVENAESRVRWFSFRHGQEAIRNLRFDVPYSFVKSTLYES
ncbi:hypothetical protein A2881_05380 [Candidatus Peribacteria bacterium RIFCSPHIGHO2_01_FULL_55_13]|nr:MAG: hypothetical protein A2881_05380 [Candidatus Peribacteria bacterium RIFCSPHIGHO2_01_FULL_55_13]OGJ66752.1 MAG: hypothetical protein A3F36_04560 [Candidatus Peribacteria bacterium RIFCSPHIGHO2_12_FULL_55_11]